MKKRRKRTLPSQLRSFGLLVCIGVLVISSCQNPLDTGHEGTNTKEPQMGTLLLTITSQTDDVQNTRTIFPDTYPTITEYYLSFTPESGQAARDPVTVITSTPAIELEVGDWTITVEGRESSGGPAVAQGTTAPPIAVGTGTTSASIDIAPTVNGVGDVDLTIDWSQVTKPVTVAVVDYFLYDINDATPPATATTIDPSGGTSVTVTGTGYGSGDYRFDVQLKDGSGNILTAVSDLVKIFDNITTASTVSIVDSYIQSPPAAPSSLLVSVVSSTRLDLSWSDNSVTDSGFSIERSTTSGSGFSWIATVGPNVTTYADDSGGAGLTPGTTYYYRVASTNSFGSSLYCTESSATTLGSLGLTITFTEPGDETITLDQSPDQTFDPLDSFNVTISETFASYDWYLDGNALSDYDGVTSISCSTLDLGIHKLICYVEDSNNRWYSKELRFYIKNTVSTISPAPTPADEETLTDATPLLDWTDVTGAVGYRVQINTASDFSGTMEVDDDTLAASQYQVATALTEGLTYYWRIKAKSDNDQWTEWSSTWSFAVSFLTSSGFSLTEVIAVGDTRTFDMGSNSVDTDEQPVHTVTLTRPYSISTYEMTNSQAAAVFNYAIDQGWVTASTSTVQNAIGNAQELLDLDSSYCQLSYTGSNLVVDSGLENYPCVEISWYGSVAFCYYLNDIEGREQSYSLSDWSCDFSKKGYRLPTEAEWEYAARGGNQSLGYTYAGSDTIDDVAWYFDNSGEIPNSNFSNGKGTHEVGLKQSNEIGAYDLSGNLWEWINDWYDPDYYVSSPEYDPEGPTTGTNKVTRGGDWANIAEYSRVANRHSSAPLTSGQSIGFRPIIYTGGP